MSDVMMSALQMKVESLTRQVEALGPENERVRNLLTEFDARHDRDRAEILRLASALAEISDPMQLATNGDPTVLRDRAREALHMKLKERSDVCDP